MERNKAILAASIILILGVLIYLNIRQSNERKTSACQALGEKRYQLELQAAKNKSEVIEPIYKWSKHYETCIYAGGILKIEQEGVFTTRHIKDLHTNKNIVAYQETIIFADEKSLKTIFTVGNQNELNILEKELR